MGISVAGHWELSWSAPLKESELWNFPLREFDVTEWWMWPVTGIIQREAKVNLHERRDLYEILEEAEGTRVFLEPRKEFQQFPSGSNVDLPDFEHPENPLYIFGSNHFNPTIAHVREGDPIVTIPTVRNDGVLWPHQCLVALLYDRMVKSCR